jgi:hypothetical protein
LRGKKEAKNLVTLTLYTGFLDKEP